MNYFLAICVICTVRATNDRKIYHKNEYTSHDCNYTSDSETLEYGKCKTCNLMTCVPAIGQCRIELQENDNLTYIDKYILPAISSCQQLNDVVCGPFNREGLLCTKCKPGYGPPLYSNSLKCEKCYDKYVVWLWLIYLLLELVPLTVFYLLVILFNIRATAPPFTALVFFCQYFTIYFKKSVLFRVIAHTYANKILLQILSTLISVWNLDMLRFVMPPFCISSNLRDIHSVLLEYTSALYPLFLVVMTYICIELHARNTRVIIILWKPFHKCFAHLKRSIDPTTSVIRTFTTFVTLSFSKIIWITFITLSPSKYDEEERSYSISLINPDIRSNYSTTEYFNRLLSTWYFIPLFTVSILMYLPTVLLLLYPIKCFRKLLSYCGPKKYHAIYVFIDTFQGHYKDGTDGTRDYRAASCISFILRLPVFYILNGSYFNLKGLFLPLAFGFIITSLFYGLAQPCKKKYMNNVESVLYCATGLISLYLGRVHVHKDKLIRSTDSFFVNLSLIVILLPSLLLLCYLLIYQISKLNRLKIFCNKLFNLLLFRDDNSAPAVLADRLVNPLNYTPMP